MFALNPKQQRRQGRSALGPPCIVYSQEEEAAAAEISEPLLSAYLEAQEDYLWPGILTRN